MDEDDDLGFELAVGAGMAGILVADSPPRGGAASAPSEAAATDMATASSAGARGGSFGRPRDRTPEQKKALAARMREGKLAKRFRVLYNGASVKRDLTIRCFLAFISEIQLFKNFLANFLAEFLAGASCTNFFTIRL